MTRQIYALVLTAVIAVFASCASSSSSEDYTLSSNCAITTVTMGTMKRTVYSTTTAGADTSYQVAIAGSSFPMYIDQLNAEIYNPDSLPINTDITKVTLSITGDGTICYRLPGGNDTLFNAKDSLDFTEPRLFTCYSSDGYQSRTYRIKVNVHNSYSEDFSWVTAASGIDKLGAITEQRLFVENGELTLFAVKGGQAVVLKAAAETPADWEESALEAFTCDFHPAAVQSMGSAFYYVDGGTVMQSADGKEWTAILTDSPVEQLVATDGIVLYGIGDGKIMMSADGTAWEQDDASSDMALLPSENVAAVCAPMKFNDNFRFVLLGGLKDSQPAVWKKTVDTTGANTEPWTWFPQEGSAQAVYPALAQPVMMSYDDKIIFMGIADGEVGNFFLSVDGGRTWAEQTGNYNHPKDIKADSFAAAADEDNFIWIVCSPSGQVLKGRLNRLSYGVNQTVFEH